MSDYAKTGDGLLTAIKIISLLKKSGLKASKFLRPVKAIPKDIKIRNIDKNIINNKIIQDMKVNMEKSLGDMGRILS